MFFVILALICGFLGNYGGAVRLGMFFMSNGGGIMAKFGLGVDLWWFWDFDCFFCYN